MPSSLELLSTEFCAALAARCLRLSSALGEELSAHYGTHTMARVRQRDALGVPSLCAATALRFLCRVCGCFLDRSKTVLSGATLCRRCCRESGGLVARGKGRRRKRTTREERRANSIKEARQCDVRRMRSGAAGGKSDSEKVLPSKKRITKTVALDDVINAPPGAATNKRPAPSVAATNKKPAPSVAVTNKRPAPSVAVTNKKQATNPSALFGDLGL